MKYPPIGKEVLGRCLFTNSYEDPYEKWLVVFYQDGKWRDTIEGEEHEVIYWREIDENRILFESLSELKSTPTDVPIQKGAGSFDSLNTPPKKKSSKWDENSLRILQEMLNKGKKRGEIATYFGVSESSIKSTKDRYKMKRQKD